jgi:serine/threonine protein phosphatase PrpC
MEDQIVRRIRTNLTSKVVFGHEKFDLVAVFDGHNGPDTSIWAGHKICHYVETLLESSVVATHDEALTKVLPWFVLAHF